MVTAPASIVVFTLGELRCAVSLEVVDRVLRAVEITPLPGAPVGVAGVINVAGQILPVYDLRRLLLQPAQGYSSRSHFILARTQRGPVALLADELEGVEPVDEGTLAAVCGFSTSPEPVAGVVRREGGLVILHDLDRFLSNEDREALERTLTA